MNKNYVLVGLLVVIAIGIIALLVGRSVPETVLQDRLGEVPIVSSETTGGGTQTSAPTSASATQQKNTGRVVFTITDEAVGLDALQSILLTVNEISVKNSQGSWVSVSKTPKTYNLLDLHRRARSELFADLGLAAGTYTQVKLSIGTVVITQKEGLKNVAAKLPSQTLTFNTKVVVEKGKTSGVSFDIDSARSLHRTGDGTFIFFPVVRLGAQHGVGLVQSLGGNVELLNGLSDFDQTFGVDENGNLRTGFSFDAATKFELVGKVVRVIPRDERSEDIKISAQAAIDAAVNSGYLTTALSVQTILRENRRVWQVIGNKGSDSATVYVDISTGTIIAAQ